MFKRILIVTEDRAAGNAAVAHGLGLAAAHAADVVFACVLPSYPAVAMDVHGVGTMAMDDFDRIARQSTERVLSRAAEAAAAAGVGAVTLTLTGPGDAEAFIAAARRRRCDVIVVATQARNAVVRLVMGSLVPGLISKATVPVFVVPARARRPAMAKRAVAKKAGAPASARKTTTRPAAARKAAPGKRAGARRPAAAPSRAKR